MEFTGTNLTKNGFGEHQAELESIINELNELLNSHKQDFGPSMVKYIHRTIKYLSDVKIMLKNIDFTISDTAKSN